MSLREQGKPKENIQKKVQEGIQNFKDRVASEKKAKKKEEEARRCLQEAQENLQKAQENLQKAQKTLQEAQNSRQECESEYASILKRIPAILTGKPRKDYSRTVEQYFQLRHRCDLETDAATVARNLPFNTFVCLVFTINLTLFSSHPDVFRTIEIENSPHDARRLGTHLKGSDFQAFAKELESAPRGSQQPPSLEDGRPQQPSCAADLSVTHEHTRGDSQANGSSPLLDTFAVGQSPSPGSPDRSGTHTEPPQCGLLTTAYPAQSVAPSPASAARSQASPSSASPTALPNPVDIQPRSTRSPTPNHGHIHRVLDTPAPSPFNDALEGSTLAPSNPRPLPNRKAGYHAGLTSENAPQDTPGPLPESLPPPPTGSTQQPSVQQTIPPTQTRPNIPVTGSGSGQYLLLQHNEGSSDQEMVASTASPRSTQSHQASSIPATPSTDGGKKRRADARPRESRNQKRPMIANTPQAHRRYFPVSTPPTSYNAYPALQPYSVPCHPPTAASSSTPTRQDEFSPLSVPVPHASSERHAPTYPTPHRSPMATDATLANPPVRASPAPPLPASAPLQAPGSNSVSPASLDEPDTHTAAWREGSIPNDEQDAFGYPPYQGQTSQPETSGRSIRAQNSSLPGSMSGSNAGPATFALPSPAANLAHESHPVAASLASEPARGASASNLDYVLNPETTPDITLWNASAQNVEMHINISMFTEVFEFAENQNFNCLYFFAQATWVWLSPRPSLPTKVWYGVPDELGKDYVICFPCSQSDTPLGPFIQEILQDSFLGEAIQQSCYAREGVTAVALQRHREPWLVAFPIACDFCLDGVERIIFP